MVNLIKSGLEDLKEEIKELSKEEREIVERQQKLLKIFLSLMNNKKEKA